MVGRMQVVRRMGVKSLLIGLVLYATAISGQIMYQQKWSLGFTGSGSNPQTKLLAGSDGTLYGTTHQGGESGRGTIFRINADGSEFKLLYAFRPALEDGSNPYSDLVFGRDGSLYGTTERGGTGGQGIIFKIRPNGSDYRALFHFTSSVGAAPRGQLLEGYDGAFYSTTQAGGAGAAGTIYRIEQDGSGFRVLSSLAPGADADTGLTLGSDGALYGVTSQGGTFDRGTMFKINQDGTGFTNLHHFAGSEFLDGEEPDGRLLELADGALYGTTERGGVGFPGFGTIYRINRDGSGYEILRRMNPTNGDPLSPTAELILGSDGALYSTGGATLFKIRPEGTGLEVLHRFVRGPDDGWFVRGVTFGSDGALYGVTQLGGLNDQGVIFRTTADGSEHRVLHHFQHVPYAPALPRSSLVRTSDGLFYGTSEGGGISNAGTIFSLGTNGTSRRLVFSFGGGTNSAKAPNGICEGGDGWLYGTTQQGGNANAGTIFKIRRSGLDYQVLRHLSPGGDPRAPRGELIEGAGGWLFGTTFSGGAQGRGAIYKVQRDTAELIVLRSLSVADGYQPQGGLSQSRDETLYGAASLGGGLNLGTLFRIQPDGSNYTILHNFSGGALGQNPMSRPIIASDGRLYGTTARLFGNFSGCIYTIGTDGSGFQVLRTFPITGPQPRNPRSALVEGADGVLYGSTLLGGAFDKGTIYRINKDGSGFGVLKEFGGELGVGLTPSAAFTVVGDGSFLGVTEAGGDLGNGTVFRFDPVEARLRIELTATTATVRWPASSTSDALEGTTGASAFDWQLITNEISREAEENRAVLTRQPDGQYFRVRRDWKD